MRGGGAPLQLPDLPCPTPCPLTLPATPALPYTLHPALCPALPCLPDGSIPCPALFPTCPPAFLGPAHALMFLPAHSFFLSPVWALPVP